VVGFHGSLSYFLGDVVDVRSGDSRASLIGAAPPCCPALDPLHECLTQRESRISGQADTRFTAHQSFIELGDRPVGISLDPLDAATHDQASVMRLTIAATPIQAKIQVPNWMSSSTVLSLIHELFCCAHSHGQP
jgi:hypothetical protein